jgi:hypothetical protein
VDPDRAKMLDPDWSQSESTPPASLHLRRSFLVGCALCSKGTTWPCAHCAHWYNKSVHKQDYYRYMRGCQLGPRNTGIGTVKGAGKISYQIQSSKNRFKNRN